MLAEFPPPPGDGTPPDAPNPSAKKRRRRKRHRRPGGSAATHTAAAPQAAHMPADNPAGPEAANRPKKNRRRGTPLKNRLRRGVGLVVINEAGQVLAGLRTHNRARFMVKAAPKPAPGEPASPEPHAAWQLPQGGIEGRERPLATAYRELEEETGLTAADVTLLHECPRWTVYHLPPEWLQQNKRFIGQTQRWYLFRYNHQGTPPIEKALHKEFSALDWVDISWLINHVISFRQPVYRQVFRAFAPFLSPAAAADLSLLSNEPSQPSSPPDDPAS